MILVLLSTVASLAALGNCQGTDCCRHAAGFDSCSTSCNAVLSKPSQILRFQGIYSLPKHCPGYLVKFWGCLRTSFPGLEGADDYNSSFHGSSCCLLSNSTKCKNECYKASHVSDVKFSCAKKTEASLLRCVDRHEATRNCCYDASKLCLTACQVVFSSDHVKQTQIDNVTKQCSRWGEGHVVQCVQNATKQYPKTKTSIKCCDIISSSQECKDTCLRELQAKKDIQIVEVLNRIEAACGVPQLTDPFWKCLLLRGSLGTGQDNTGKTYPTSVIDGAKLQCCSKAIKSNCWRLCVQMYTTRWGERESWNQFDTQCAYDPDERAMLNCLADVTEPCQLGCSGLNYCTNFNNRPTELFRSCNAKSNIGAKHDMESWAYGSINMPSIKIPVKDIAKCMPESWKAIACVLQIKPCHVKSHGNTICWKDCMDILEKCADKTKLKNVAIEDVCRNLSPDNAQDSCISISNYLKTGEKSTKTEVTHPCHPSPCEAGICDINRKCFPGSSPYCTSYTCTPGCLLGERSSFLVRVGDQARLPVVSGKTGCFKVCHCSTKNRLTECVNLDRIPKKACSLNDQLKDHDTRFYVDCNFCVCYAGELTCTHRQCPKQAANLTGRLKRNGQLEGTEELEYTGLPCGCSDVQRPFCGSNGKTYPNLCLAKCAGLENDQIFRGSCAERNPCSPNPCNPGQSCIVERKMCLALDVPCHQYQCNYDLQTCDDTKLEPVCDTEDKPHPNLCFLYRNGKTLAYPGLCKPSCQAPYHKVCGIDSTTYDSHCTALAARVLVDYEGQCVTVGLAGSSNVPSCQNVICPKTKHSKCIGLIPPGACCPVCGAIVRILYSVKHLLVRGQILSDFGPVTLGDVLENLRRHVTTSECDLFGYLSLEGDLVILIMAITDNPTELQIEACNKEAQKIEALINRGSPALSSDVALSTLKGAISNITHLSNESRSGSSHHSCVYSLFVLVACLLIHYVISR